MHQISLTTPTGDWKFRQAGQQEWLPAQAPGGVHTDLLAAGLIPDPFVGDNERQVQWVAETNWEYLCTFDVPAELLAESQIFLVCDGLDTLARVSLNGHVLGLAENMFRQYRWEVTHGLRGVQGISTTLNDLAPLLKPQGNQLSIYFDSVVNYMSEKQQSEPLPGVSQALPGGPHVRKAPCQFGWDWGPMLPPIGIWKDLRLEGYTTARLGDIHLRQFHGAQGVLIQTDVKVHGISNGGLPTRPTSGSEAGETKVQLSVIAPDGQSWSATGSETPGSEAGETTTVALEVKDPQLWWPNGYGNQPLYQVQVSLLDAADAGSGYTVLDKKTYQLGLRTLELSRKPDEWGESFTFVVNGVPIYAKGSNWIPADSFPTRLTDEFMEHLIRSAAETHQNMLRVWGGGFYEEERFYDLCDRYGILVWQDGIFSCSVYPLGDEAFLENVKVEIFENVRRLRHRASLALWCGNNEMEWGWESWGWQQRANEYKDAYDRFFHKLLPEWIAELDPDTPYWPSSPSSQTPFENVNSQERGDAHYWEVWHGRRPFTAYRSVYPRFMSEFGFQSLATLETIRAYAKEEDMNMTSYIMEYHQRSGSGNGLMVAQLTDWFLLPCAGACFESLVYLSLVLQAEGIRYGVEHWRRHKQRVSGTLYWQINDCWPVASWSSIDYFGRWKALHYLARRFYAPLLLSIEDLEGAAITGQGTAFAAFHKPKPVMKVWVTSDMNQPFEGALRWSLINLAGKTLQSGEAPVSLAAQGSQAFASPEFELSYDEKREVVFVAELFQSAQFVSSSRAGYSLATFVPNKHLRLQDPLLESSTMLVTGVTQQDASTTLSRLQITLTSQSLARFVELKIKGQDIVFSDNYFDVLPGAPVTVECVLPQGMTLAEARGVLQVRSLYDAGLAVG